MPSPSVPTASWRSRNAVLAGTTLTQGRAQGVVFATGMRTEFGRLAHLTQRAAPPSSRLQADIARVSHVVAVLAVLLGVTFFLIGQLVGLPFVQNFIFGIGIIVANVPEGLLPTVTLSLAMASRRMATRNVLVRHLGAIDALGATTVVCTDKTGTLTQNRMTVARVWLDRRTMTVADLDAARESVATRHERFFAAAVLCEDIERTTGQEHRKAGTQEGRAGTQERRNAERRTPNAEGRTDKNVERGHARTPMGGSATRWRWRWPSSGSACSGAICRGRGWTNCRSTRSAGGW